MTIQPLNATFSIPGDPGALGAYLTPDALMSYCTTRLQGLDSQMNAAFAQQQKANDDSQLLSNLEQAMPLPDDTALEDSGKTQTQLQMTYDKIKAQIAKLDPTDPAAKSLQTILDSIGTEDTKGVLTISPTLLNGRDHITSNDFKTTIIDAVSNAQKDLNSGAELTMINLQSVMSQRQEAIQLTTNLVQSLGDQCNKIADNVGK